MYSVSCLLIGVAPQPLQCDSDYSETYVSYNCSSDEGVSSVECLLDGVAYSDCTLIALHILGHFSGVCIITSWCFHTGQLSNTLLYSEFSLGLHTLELLVTTSAGNTANMSFIFYTPPGEVSCFLRTDSWFEEFIQMAIIIVHKSRNSVYLCSTRSKL